MAEPQKSPHEQFMDVLSRAFQAAGNIGPGMFDTTMPEPAPITGRPERGPTIGPVTKSFDPSDPTALLREKAHELSGTERFIPTDLLALLQQSAGPEGFSPVGQAAIPGYLSRDMAKRFANRAAAQMRSDPNLGRIAPRSTEIISRMFERHPEIGGQMAAVGTVLDPRASARYGFIQIHPSVRGEFDEMMLKILRRDPTTSHTPTNDWIRLVGSQMTDDDLAQMVLERANPRFQFNPKLETKPPAETYKATRHEFGHALEDLRGKLHEPTMPRDPLDLTYWIHPQEARSNAIEMNYGRDMGRDVAGFDRPGVLRHPPGPGQTKGRLATYPELISDQLSMGLAEAESGLHQGLAMPPDFEDMLRQSVDYLFRGPKARYKEPAFPAYWKSYFD